MSNPVGRVVGAGRALLRRQRDRRPWLDHLVHAGGHYNRAQGDVLAAGVTYYVFLALFPVVLLVAAVAGFVLRGDPLLEDQLVRGIRDAVPGDTGRQLAEQVNGAVDAAGTFGVVGLAGFLLVGLGAMDKLRVGMDVVWRGRPDPPDFLGDRLKDLGALLGLGAAGALSIALTTAATAASARVLDALGLAERPGAFLLTGALAIGLALIGDTLVFLWVLKGVPGNPFGVRQLLPGAVFGAVGFEVLKLVGNWYLGRIGQNVTAQTLGSFVGLVVWINVVARFAFYTASWTATIRSIEHAHTLVPHGPAGPTPLPEVALVDERGPGPSPVRLALGLLGVGAAAGALVSRLVSRSWARRAAGSGRPTEDA
ncbi:YihY/virulence factor BrkB family protein [Modestobacter sp. L9-4]|uniref:YihY/virulence factor BrkB family protein n=1 Tax=Modestobacter sp. L9-4 TaxID=2851567 RepID=UPI001C77A506|nr:YihY/virulence factor BrkB family protein [Modestobacter sp. L9-4]QXG77223.1 YihY/virulence factor BrkB family protein [Modestobacter sp. L9-4]